MPRIIPVGFAEAALSFVGGSGTAPYVTTIGVSLVGVAPENYVQVANNIMAAYGVSLMGQTDPTLSLESVTLAVGLDGDTSGSVSSNLGPIAGGGSGDYAPVAMAAIARKSSASLGRAGRGRSFLPGTVRDASVDTAGNLTGGAVTALSGLWNDFLVDIATAEPGFAAAPVILHQDGSTPSPIIAGSVATKVGWIRKRIR